MSIEDRLRRALDSAAHHVDAVPPKRSDGRPTARVAAVEMRRHRWPMTIAAAAVIAVAVGVIAIRGTSDPQRLATQQVAPRNSTRSAPVASESTTTVSATAVSAAPVPATLLLATAPSPSTFSSSSTLLPVAPSSTEAQPTTIPAAALPVTVVSGGPSAPFCNDTDPGMSAISVSQAKTCPDGTTVLVSGVIIADGVGNRYLCDSSSSATSATCSAEGLTVVGGGAAGAEGEYSGVISGKRLVVGFSARPVTPVGSLVPIPTIPD